MPNIFNFCLKQLNQILKAVVCIVAFIVSGQVWCDVFVDRTMLHTLDLTYAQDHLIFTLSLSLILLLSFPISLRNFIVFFFYLCSVLFLWRFLSLSLSLFRFLKDGRHISNSEGRLFRPFALVAKVSLFHLQNVLSFWQFNFHSKKLSTTTEDEENHIISIKLTFKTRIVRHLSLWRHLLATLCYKFFSSEWELTFYWDFRVNTKCITDNPIGMKEREIDYRSLAGPQRDQVHKTLTFAAIIDHW